MNAIPLYSLVIFPSPPHSEAVKEYKRLLRQKIGWFGSFNAAAHITVMNFSDEAAVSEKIPAIISFCDTATPEEVVFDSFGSFGDKTFFIAANQASQQYLDKLIGDFHIALGANPKNIHAHMSIARQLNAEKMRQAQKLFEDTIADFRFVCDAFYLRKFNEATKQYSDIVEKFPFKY
jgi:hypothetical protein